MDLVAAPAAPASPILNAAEETRRKLLAAARAVSEYVRARELRRFAPLASPSPVDRQ